MKVNFIVERSKSVTGIGRYSSTIIRFLEKQGITTNVQFTDPKLPMPLTKLAGALGYDLNTFMGHYPIRIPKVEASVHHLTTESVASLLWFQNIQPSVVTTHGPLTYLLRNDPEMSIPTHFFDRWFENVTVKAFRRANHVITDSQFLADFLVNDVKLPPEQVSVIYLAVDHELFAVKPLAADFVQRHSLKPDEHRYIVYTGSEQPRKNLITLIEAFAVIQREFPDTRLLKIGKPEFMEERAKAEKRIQELGLEGTVQFIGYVSEDDLVAFYNLATIFVFPSRFEGFGLPPLEAMACGAPVVSSAATALAEVVGDGALVFEPRNTVQLIEHLRRLLTNEDERLVLRQRGLQRAQQFTWDKTATETLAVYQKVIGVSSQGDA